MATETVTVMFTDMVGSTALIDRLGPKDAERVRREHMQQLRAAVALSGGREIKNVGDGLMVAFGGAGAAVSCAIEMQRRVDARPDTGGSTLKVGIAAGDADVEGSDYFGAPVIEASRLCAAAGPGQILVTDLVRLLAGGRGSHIYTPLGPMELKGFDQPVAACEVIVEADRAEPPVPGDLHLPLPSLLSLAPAVSFVARPAEWDQLEAAWAAVAQGRRAVLVGGEPGTGKTRIVTEFACAVHRRGALVLYGGCTDDFELPYQPFVQALDHLVAVVGPQTALELAGKGAPDLAKLLRHLARERVTSTTAGDSDADRYRLLEAVVELLTNLGHHGPVLLVLEDLHWARRPTMQLLEHLLRSSGLANVCVVGTYRTAPADVGEALGEALPDLRRLAGVHRVALGGFDRPAVREFVTALADHDVTAATEPLVDVLLAHTAGNAFLISELWRHLVETGHLIRVGPQWTIAGRLDDFDSPEAVRDVVRRRLSSLPPVTLSILEVAAVAGTSFELELIARAADTTPAVVVEALEPALANRLVEEAGTGAFRFAHALVQRSVEDVLPAIERRRKHLQVGNALTSSQHGERRLDELAHHFLAAVPLAPRATAVDYARRAARASLKAVAYEQAVELLQEALPFTDDDRTRADLLLDLATAKVKSGDIDGGIEAAGAAADLARGQGDGAGLVAAAMLYEQATWRGARYGSDAEQLVREALPHAADEASRVALLACQSRALAFSGRDEDALVIAEAAIAAARALQDGATLCDALHCPLFVQWRPETFVYQEACAREAADIATALGDEELLLGATDKMMIGAVMRGDRDETRRILARHGPLARQVRQPLFLLNDATVRSHVALSEGRLADAEACAEEAASWGHLLPNAVGGYGVQLFGIRREQGRLEEARPFVEAVARRGKEGATWRPGLAALYADLGMFDEAAALLHALTDHKLSAVGRDALWCGSLSYLADAAVATADRASAAVLYPLLLPYRGLAVTIPALACYGSADRFLGTLATMLDRPREGVAHLEAAVAFDDRSGARTWAAHSRFELGRLLGRQVGRDPRARAGVLFQEALTAAEEIGLAHLAGRCREELERLDHTADGSGPDVLLTSREVVVLTLVAEGRTNREIGTRLSISQHTVANHVRAILLKTGCSNRTEAAAWALRQGVLSTRGSS